MKKEVLQWVDSCESIGPATPTASISCRPAGAMKWPPRNIAEATLWMDVIPYKGMRSGGSK